MGIIRLTVDGTKLYVGLGKVDKENFIEKMRLGISESIPVDESRLIYINHFLKYEKSELLFITFRINPPNNNNINNKSAKDIFGDFESLLKIYNVKTSLDMNDTTKYIDKSFGLRRACKCSLYFYMNCFLIDLMIYPFSN